MATIGKNSINAKLVLLGDVGTGKSSLALRFVEGQFLEFQESTIGAAFFSQTLAVSDATVKLEIWDTAGQEIYHSLAPMYYRGAAAAIIVFDISRMESFERAKKWVQELQSQSNPSMVTALAGNKCDLEDKRMVPTEEAQTFAAEHGLFFMETSAKTAINVNDIFYEIAKRLPRAQPTQMKAESGGSSTSIEDRPAVLLIGSPNVGKRTLLSRLTSIDFPVTSDLSTGILCQGWTVETKYYTADVSIWTAHLNEEFSFQSLPINKQLDALVMVFDMSDESSLTSIQEWVAKTDISNFEILLCIGNKVDLVTGHSAHSEYRRRMQKHGESTSDPHPEYADYGIDETEACSLLGNEEPSSEIRKLCLDWCIKHNIEYIEACASNADFDKCLSVDGDMQGVDRLFGALSAHMWPGMILKSGNKITNPSLVEKEESTDDESDYEIEYEALSHGSDEEWGRYTHADMTKISNGTVNEINQDARDNMFDTPGTSSALPGSCIPSGFPNNSASVRGITDGPDITNNINENHEEKHERETSMEERSGAKFEEQEELQPDIVNPTELDDDAHYGLDDLERLMYEIGNMRDNLRLMPDFQRREMAAKLAMKMAAMFAEGSDDEVAL